MLHACPLSARLPFLISDSSVQSTQVKWGIRLQVLEESGHRMDHITVCLFTLSEEKGGAASTTHQHAHTEHKTPSTPEC